VVILMDNYFTPQQVAEKLQLNIGTVYEWIREGKLKAVKVGDLWCIPESELKQITSFLTPNGLKVRLNLYFCLKYLKKKMSFFGFY